MTDEHLRIGDAEREQAAAALGEHYAQGRISADEHAERLEQIWVARTRAELRPVFRDLPGPADPRQAAPRGRGPRGIPGPLVVVLVVLGALTVLTHVPFLVLGVLAVFFVVSRRRHRLVGHGRGGYWSR